MSEIDYSAVVSPAAVAAVAVALVAVVFLSLSFAARRVTRGGKVAPRNFHTSSISLFDNSFIIREFRYTYPPRTR